MEEDEPLTSSEARGAPALAPEEGLSTPVAGPETPFRPTSGMPGLTPTGPILWWIHSGRPAPSSLYSAMVSSPRMGTWAAPQGVGSIRVIDNTDGTFSVEYYFYQPAVYRIAIHVIGSASTSSGSALPTDHGDGGCAIQMGMKVAGAASNRQRQGAWFPKQVREESSVK